MAAPATEPAGEYGARPRWEPELPRIRAGEVILRWFVSAVALLVASSIISQVQIERFADAVAVAAIIAGLNAVLSPLLAALRIPFIALVGFVLVLRQPRPDLPDGREASPDSRGDRRPASQLLPALRAHPHIGFLLVRSSADGPVVLGARGTRYLSDGRVAGDDPLDGFSPNAAQHFLRSDGFSNAPDVLINSFYDPVLEEACAFEELISFHGGLGGSQTEAFILHPASLTLPDEPIVGAERVNEVLRSWRTQLQGRPAT